VRQPQALGLGHAVLCARKVVGDHPFAVLLADDLIDTPHSSCLTQMLERYHQENASVIAVQEIAPEDSQKYGVVAFDLDKLEKGRISAIVEKPIPEEAPSCFGVVGRYVLTPDIFRYLEKIQPGLNGEIQLTDAIACLLSTHQVLALPFEGKRYDCGSKIGYMQASIAFGLKHPELKENLRDYLRHCVL
jgi:UTP--glucose-1-phosphate uridylyltransferase